MQVRTDDVVALNQRIKTLRTKRDGADNPQGRGRADGELMEVLTASALRKEGWQPANSTNPVAAKVLEVVATRFCGTAVGRNSATEGFWESKNGDSVYVEASGTFSPKAGVPGLRRSDTAHKISSRVRIAAQAAQRAQVGRLHAIVATSHLPKPGSETAGVFLALQDVVDLEIWVLSEQGEVVEALSGTTLRSRLTPLAA